ncbi:hypothetical protein [Kribbella sp. CA-247076]|uniref:hypothetical protein n=1 Tax=Kribbella sp. CA-247076 TaxID=3239941 RepID=UPI003D91D608
MNAAAAPDRDWSEDEVHRLHQLAQLAIPTQVIGLKLARTLDSVVVKAGQLGLELPATHTTP